MTKATTTNKTTKNTTTSGNYLVMWHQNAEGKWRPTKFALEIVDGVMHMAISKNKDGEHRLKLSYNHKDGKKEFTVGPKKDELGKLWVSTPKIVESVESAVVTH